MNDKDKSKLRNREEINLIADYQMEYGLEEHWSDELTKEFNEKWDAIQNATDEKKEDVITTSNGLYNEKICGLSSLYDD